MTSLSVLVPVYNEQHLVAASLARLELLETSPHLEAIQVIVVDDCSRDATPEALRAFARERGVAWRDDGPIENGVELKGHGRRGRVEWVFLRHVLNGGKGRAVRTALAEATCDLTVIHDADLEYHPRDLLRIVKVFVEEEADAVFGSRFAGGEARRALLFRHELGNRLLTFLTNLITNVNLTDMETCYKAVRTSLLKSIPLVSNDFRMEPELTIKLAKRDARIFEVPISYSGRTYQEGKKINWKDGFRALAAMVRFWISDRVYAEDAYGSQILGRLSRAPRFNAWMADVIRPHCGRRVLEIGSGTGNLTRRLVPRDAYVASDVNPLYLQTLRHLTHDRPYLDVTLTDVTREGTFPTIPGGFDTVVCLNVIEHVDDDRGALENIRRVLAPEGRAILLVPQGPGLFGTLDEVLGHKRRYTEASLRAVAGEAGFEVERVLEFNRVGTPAWWLNGKVLRRRHFGLLQVAALNALTPLFRRIDRVLPFRALSLVAVVRPAAAATAVAAAAADATARLGDAGGGAPGCGSAAGRAKRSRLHTYLRILRFARPYRGRFAAALACMAVLALATTAYVNLLGPALDFLFTGRTTGVSSLARVLPRSLDVAGFVSSVDRGRMLAILPIVIVCVSLVKGLAYFGQSFLMTTTSQRMIADMRRALFDKVVRLPPAFHARHHSGDVISRFSADVGLVQNAVTEAVATYLRDGLTVVAMLVNCFILDWKLSLIAFGAIPATLLPVVRISKRLRRTTGDSVATLGYISEIALEAVAGIRVIQSFCTEAWESRRFTEANRRWLKLERRIAAVRAFSSPLMEVMGAVGIAAAIWWVGGRILSNQLEPGKFFSFLAAVLLLYQPVKQLGRVGQTAIVGAAAGDRIFEILDAVTSVPDAGTGVLAPPREAIRFERVGFSYGDRPVLRDLDLEIRRGEVVALVGPSGGGKTTVANLLPRFWDPVSGRITIDGTDLRDVTLRSLREQIAVVGQETVLFNDTIRANIAYGRDDVPAGAVERAARVAQAHDFVSALPAGYETRVGERGALLSGGQRQRIAIARAVLKDAPILVLDEATSALDAESEREVQRALDALMALDDGRHRTTLVIAHRLSTIRNADRIVVLVEGRVAETGRHEELLGRGGEYARLWRIFEGEARDPEAVPA